MVWWSAFCITLGFNLSFWCCSYVPNPVLVIIDVQPKELGIPTKAYYAVEEVKEVNTSQFSNHITCLTVKLHLTYLICFLIFLHLCCFCSYIPISYCLDLNFFLCRMLPRKASRCLYTCLQKLRLTKLRKLVCPHEENKFFDGLIRFIQSIKMMGCFLL